MDSIMKLYFIIPVYKTEKYLARCIESVVYQKDAQILLVDDGSPDSCPKICDDYAKQYQNITVIHKENGGLSDARNAGLTYLKQVALPDDYITFLDSDDYVSQTFTNALLSLGKRYDCDLIQCEYLKGTEESFPEELVGVDGKTVIKSGEEMLLNQRLKSQSCAKIYRFSVLKDIFFPKGVLNEDEFTTYRSVYRSKRVMLTEKKLYYYYQHEGSIMDDVAKRLKNSKHLLDWYHAYEQRISFFEKENKPIQVMRTHEKICTDVILRYCEQMYLKKDMRDEAFSNGEYLRLYKNSYPLMIKRNGISWKRKMMYRLFYLFPKSAVLPGKIFGLRK